MSVKTGRFERFCEHDGSNEFNEIVYFGGSGRSGGYGGIGMFGVLAVVVFLEVR